MLVAATACTGDSPDPEGSPSPGADGTGVVGAGGPDDVPCTAPDMPGVAIIADRDRLILPDGRAFPLTGVPGGAIDGVQTCDGWLVRGLGPAPGPGPYSLWLVRSDGSLTSVVAEADGPVAIAPDGRHFAWRWNGELLAGRMDWSGAAVVDVTSPAPQRGQPISMSASVVILGYTETGGGIDHHDVWIPDQGDYVPTWDQAEHVRALYRPSPDGEHFLGLVDDPAQARGEERVCLAELDPRDGLRAGRTACGVALAFDRFSDIDPDGRRLAVFMIEQDGDRVIGLVDLSTVFTTPTFDAVLSGPSATDAAFEDATHLLVANEGGGLVRFDSPFRTSTSADRPGVSESTTITALMPRLAGSTSG
jgi:hypothetical protein